MGIGPSVTRCRQGLFASPQQTPTTGAMLVALSNEGPSHETDTWNHGYLSPP